MVSVYIILSAIVIAFCITVWAQLNTYEQLDDPSDL